MVSFMFASVIDYGNSILKHSSRVKNEYEDKGIATRMRDFCMKNIPKTAHTTTFATISSIVLEKLLQKLSANLVFRRNIEHIFSSNSNLTTAEDYHDVVSVRKHFYGGLDYIPSRYYQYLETFTGFGGYIGNDMVSFLFASIIDDGHGILIHSLRVKKEYEGQGIATRMRKYCTQNLSNTAHQKIVTVVSSIDMEKVLRNTSEHVVFQRNMSIFKTTSTAIRPILKSKHKSPSLQIVDEAYLADVIACHRASASLFPENRIVESCHPYKLVSSNIERITKSY